MLKDILQAVGSFIISTAIIVGGWLGVEAPKPLSLPESLPILGADNVLPVGLATYYLSGSGVSSSATSITLTSLTLPQNGYKIQDSDVSVTFYITLEPGNRSRQEFVSCTTIAQNSAGTATLSGCTRGLSPVTPFTASSTLQFAHAGGTAIIFSNPPQLYNQTAFKTNDETITGLWTFDGNLPISTLSATGSTQFATKAYVDIVGLQGAATSTEALGGIVRLGTGLQMASSTVITDNPFVLHTGLSTSTPGLNATTTIPVTQFNGKLHKSFWDLTVDYTWTGNHTFSGTAINFSGATTNIKNLNASSTSANPIVLNGVSLNTPSTQGASSTALLNDGSGSLTWNPVGSPISFGDGLKIDSTNDIVFFGAATTTFATGTLPYIVSRAGTLKNMYVNAGNTITPSGSIMFQVIVNNASTSLTAFLDSSSSSATNTSMTASVLQGDRVVIKADPNLASGGFSNFSISVLLE